MTDDIVKMLRRESRITIWRKPLLDAITEIEALRAENQSWRSLDTIRLNEIQRVRAENIAQRREIDDLRTLIRTSAENQLRMLAAATKEDDRG